MLGAPHKLAFRGRWAKAGRWGFVAWLRSSSQAPQQRCCWSVKFLLVLTSILHLSYHSDS